MVRVKIFLSIIILVMIIGCKNTRNVRPNVYLEKESLEFEQLENIQEVYYRFPSPDEMLNFIDKEKLDFNDHFLLPVNNATQYLDSKAQALNLGVYIADLAYITLFQHQKEALTYFQVVYRLSDKLRMSSAFDPGLMRRIENNLKNADSLKVLADIAMNGIINYLVENDKEKTFAIISIGGYVESLYLAFNLAGSHNEKNPIIQRISDQKLVLENLIDYSLIYAGDKNVSEAIKLLHPIRSSYNELITINEETSVSKDKDGKLIISGGQKITITEEQYNKLRDITFTTRKAITENKEN